MSLSMQAGSSIDQFSTQETPKSNRRKLFKLHSWVGFHLAFIMVVVLATGTIATVSNEIDWLAQSEMRVSPGDNKVSWQTMTDAIKAFSPNSTLIEISDMGANYFAYRATIKNQYSQRQYVYVNQWTGEVNGATGLVTVQRVFRDLHRYLFMPKVLGLLIVGSMAFILLISLYTGLKTARNRKTLMTRIRINKGSRVLLGDAHKAAGLWSIWFVALMAVSGIWYLAELGFEIGAYASKNEAITFEPSRPSLTQDSLAALGKTITQRTTADIVEAAQHAFPELNISQIRLPEKPGQAINVLGTRTNPILRSRANQVFLEPVSLRAILVQRSENLTWVAWLNQIVDPLHFGFFGGLITKLIWFVFGAALTGLSITGVILAWKRLKSKSASTIQLATLPVLFIGLLFAYFYWYPTFSNPEKPYAEQTFYHATQKGFDLELRLGLDANNQPDGSLRLLAIANGSYANIKSISIALRKSDQNVVEAQKLKLKHFSESSVYAGVFSAASIMQTGLFFLTIELNSGGNIELKWETGLKT